MKHQIIVTRTFDTDGEPIVLVPLTNHPEPARLDAADFDRLEEEGHTLRWFLNDNGTGCVYVRFTDPVKGNNGMVARSILDGLPPRTVIRYRDGDRLNLRRSNLSVTKSWADGFAPLGEREAAQAGQLAA